MSRRNTELLLLIASAFPVILLYAMYVLTAGAAISFETLAVPIGLFAAFAAAHIAVRILAPGADPAILPAAPFFVMPRALRSCPSAFAVISVHIISPSIRIRRSCGALGKSLPHSMRLNSSVSLF